MSKKATTDQEDVVNNMLGESKQAQIEFLLNLEVSLEKNRQRQHDVEHDQYVTISS